MCECAEVHYGAPSTRGRAQEHVPRPEESNGVHTHLVPTSTSVVIWRVMACPRNAICSGQSAKVRILQRYPLLPSYTAAGPLDLTQPHVLTRVTRGKVDATWQSASIAFQTGDTHLEDVKKRLAKNPEQHIEPDFTLIYAKQHA